MSTNWQKFRETTQCAAAPDVTDESGRDEHTHSGVVKLVPCTCTLQGTVLFPIRGSSVRDQVLMEDR